jgi:2'-5' RNA ligase
VTAGPQRLFFALWPNQAVRESVAKVVEAQSKTIQGRWIDTFNLHMTLHFLGNIEANRVSCFHQKAQLVKALPFELRIDRYGYFERPKVLWLGCREASSLLFDLHKNLGEQLVDCGFQVERRSYHPHITLARKLNQPKEFPQLNLIEWQVDSFSLIESVPTGRGVRYQVLENYSLN